jgi:hypothetical protein
MFYEFSRRFAWVALIANVMNSLFYSRPETVCDDHIEQKLSNSFEFSVNNLDFHMQQKLSNLFEFSVNSFHKALGGEKSARSVDDSTDLKVPPMLETTLSIRFSIYRSWTRRDGACA